MALTDQDIVQTAPLSHLLMVARARRLTAVQELLHDASLSDTVAQEDRPSPRLAASITPLLFADEELPEWLTRLNDAESFVLREVVDCGGRVNSRDLAFYFQRSLGLDEEEPSSTLDNQQPAPVSQEDAASHVHEQLLATHYPEARHHGAFELAVYQLLKWGLLFWGRQTHFEGQAYLSGAHDGVLVAPSAIVQAVQRHWPSTSQEETDDTSVLDAASDVARSFQRALYLYWSYVASLRDGLPLVNSGLLSRSAIRTLCEHLSIEYQSEQMRLESDVAPLLFIRLLLQQLGLLQVRQGVLVALPGLSFFSLPLSERILRCYQTYAKTPFWNEMIRLVDVNIRPAPDPLTPAVSEVLHARQQIFARLLHDYSLDDEQGVDLLVFITRTRLHIPALLFPRQYGPRSERYTKEYNPYGYDFRLRRGWLTYREGWYVIEGGFICDVCTGPLSWLGILSLERRDSHIYCHLTAEGRALLQGQSLQYREPDDGRLLVQPNFELVAMAPVSEGSLVMLNMFAECVRLEHVAQYRLTKASVTRALRSGMSTDTLLRYLEQRVAADGNGGGDAAKSDDIPQNVRYSLREWERQARRMELWPAVSLIEVEDAVLLDSLIGADETRDLIGRRLTPTIAEVPTPKLTLLQEALWKQELLPALTAVSEHELQFDGDSDLFPRQAPQWRLHESGLLEPLYPVLDLYLVAAIARFSTVDERKEKHKGWPRITRVSLQTALRQGLVLESILHFLRLYCVDGIPGSLQIRYKLWGNGYQSAPVQVVESSLLSLSDEVLNDIRADEELAPLLGEEVSDSQRLVLVPRENLARVVSLLQERGLTLINGSSEQGGTPKSSVDNNP